MEVAASRRVFDMFFWRATYAGRDEESHFEWSFSSKSRDTAFCIKLRKGPCDFRLWQERFFTGKPSLARSHQQLQNFKSSLDVGVLLSYNTSILQYFYIVDSLLLSAHCQNKIEYS
eukprot:scaffold2971_cov152-Skeletonema_menzelii.AAC.3